MGRKSKPVMKKRMPRTVSLPLFIHSHFEKITASGLTISRYIENLVTNDIKTKQDTLIRQVWECKPCEKVWHTNNPSNDFALCKSCRKDATYVSTLKEYQNQEEE